MLRSVLDYVVRAITRLKRRQRIKPDTPVVSVNLGSGLAVAPGWINIDTSLNTFFARWPTPIIKQAYRLSGSRRLYTEDGYLWLLKHHWFVQHDLTHSVPFECGSVDYIYSSHFIEHIPMRSARRLLKDAYRVLKHGGRMRLCVPDLSYAVSLYLQGEKERALEICYVPDAEGQFGRHQYMYDFEMLQSLLTRIGFREVTRCRFREGQVPDIDTLDNRPEQTLYLEAVK